MKRRHLVVFACGVLACLSRFFDFPAFPDRYEGGVDGLLDPSTTRFYTYSLCDFLALDKDFFWRIDGNQTAIKSALTGLGLQRTEPIPPEFWRLSPYYWPKGSFNGAEAYRSPWFESTSRGYDGRHYFAVHDTVNNRAFVWVKANF
jgi:hypothetical protein